MTSSMATATSSTRTTNVSAVRPSQQTTSPTPDTPPPPYSAGRIPTSELNKSTDRLLGHLELLQAFREERLAAQKEREAALRRKNSRKREDRRRARRLAGQRESDTDYLPSDFGSDYVPDKSDEESAFETVDLETGERIICSSEAMRLRAQESRERMIAAMEGLKECRSRPVSGTYGAGGVTRVKTIERAGSAKSATPSPKSRTRLGAPKSATR